MVVVGEIRQGRKGKRTQATETATGRLPYAGTHPPPPSLGSLAHAVPATDWPPCALCHPSWSGSPVRPARALALPPREARSDLIAGWVPDAATTSHLPAPLPSAARRRISPCSLSFYTGARLARRRESSSACGRPRSGHPVAGLVQEPSGGDEGKVGRPRAHRLHFHPPWSPLWLLDWSLVKSPARVSHSLERSTTIVSWTDFGAGQSIKLIIEGLLEKARRGRLGSGPATQVWIGLLSDPIVISCGGGAVVVLNRFLTEAVAILVIMFQNKGNLKVGRKIWEKQLFLYYY